MTKRVFIFTTLLMLSCFIFSLDSIDQSISKELFNIYGDNVTLDKINKVLEFDEYNETALIKKAFLLEYNNYSLWESKEILEQTLLPTLQSQFYYISILYRLGLYKDLIKYFKNIDLYEISDVDTLFYISDSLLRLKDIKMTLEVLKYSTHQFPLDVRFLELEYIIENQRQLLTEISNITNPINSFIRIYSRINNQVSKFTLEILLKRELSKISPTELNKYIGNYSIFPIVLELFTTNILDGVFSVDRNNDTFIDTYFKIVKGNIVYKSVDYDFDNIKDFECYLEDSLPIKIELNGSFLIYKKYPYIDSISLKTEVFTVYDLYKNHTKYVILNLNKDYILNPDFSSLDKLKLISKIIYDDKKIVSKSLYKTKDSVSIYSDKNLKGGYDNFKFMENGLILYQLTDIDSDGIYDVHYQYEHGVLTKTVFRETDKKEWWIK